MAGNRIAHAEVSEFMVRRLNSHVIPGLRASPDSGVVFDGLTTHWVPETPERCEIDFDHIYKSCLEAQKSFINTANKLCKKRNLQCIASVACHSWSEVEESVVAASSALEELVKKDKTISPGVTGKLKSGFRSLCQNAGAGVSIVNLIPNDSYSSVLCGGLKMIFTALQQTDLYRNEIFNAVEDIPFILNDHASLVKLNKEDEELHRRAAALYASLFRLMEVIIGWFLKSAKRIGARMIFDPSGFSDKLKDALAEVKLSVQRFEKHTMRIATQDRHHITQQNYELMYMQGQNMYTQNENSKKILGSIEELSSRLFVLESLAPLLDLQQDECECNQVQFSLIMGLPKLAIDGILEIYLYEPDIVLKDCETIRQMQFRAGVEVDEDRIVAIQANPRFQSWLTLNESSLLLINANSEQASNMDMSFVSAKTFQRAIDVSREQREAGGRTTVIPLAFFCSQHRDFWKDQNAVPAELVLSLLLQLLDQYRDFDPRLLATVAEDLDPENIESICEMLHTFISRLANSVILIIIIDGLKFFTHPMERREEMREVVARLVQIHRQETAVTVKILFANSSRAEFVEDMFTDDERLRMPRDLVRTEGYNTLMWKRPVTLIGRGDFDDNDGDDDG